MVELLEALRIVERWHREGDDYVREAATIGLLESLQNLNHHSSSTSPDQFRALLGSESLRCWDELQAWWATVYRYQESQHKGSEPA